jgi:hypothetical protein
MLYNFCVHFVLTKARELVSCCRNLLTQSLIGRVPCCFLRALSQMAGRRWTFSPLGRAQRMEHTSTPRQDFLSMCTLWLFVLRIAQPEAWRFASSLDAGYTSRQWPSAHSSHRLYSLTCTTDFECISYNCVQNCCCDHCQMSTEDFFSGVKVTRVWGRQLYRD